MTLEHLPNETPEQKKRKKRLLLFLQYWKELQDEVKRIQKELDQQHVHHSTTNTIKRFGRIISRAKGPLGLFTIAAVDIVLWTYHANDHTTVKTSMTQPFRTPTVADLAASGISPSIPFKGYIKTRP